MALEINREENDAIQACWEKFIAFVREKLENSMSSEHRELGLKMGKLSLLKKILRSKPNDISLLFRYKDVLIDVSPEVVKKVELLEAFNKRSNLDNDIAQETYKSIIDDEALLDKVDAIRDELLEKRDQLHKKMLDTADLINGKKYTYELMLEFINESNLSKEEHNMILFAGFNFIVKNMEARMQSKANTLTYTEDDLEIVDVVEKSDVAENEKNEFILDEVIQKYETAKDSISSILNKYYEQINDASPETKAAYYAYASYDNDEMKNEVPELQYEETQAKIQVIKLIKHQQKIEDYIAEARNVSDHESIYAELIDEEVEKYIDRVERLMNLEKEIETNEKPDPVNFETSKLFFITDESGHLLIPNEIVNGYTPTLKTFEDKVNSGDLLRRQGSKVLKMKGVGDCESWINKTIFMQMSRNKPIISYVKVNLINENDPAKSEEGIAIITACAPKPNIIKEETRDVLKINRQFVCQQLEKIEHKDPDELNRQATIRAGLFGGINNGEDISEVNETTLGESGNTRR